MFLQISFGTLHSGSACYNFYLQDTRLAEGTLRVLEYLVAPILGCFWLTMVCGKAVCRLKQGLFAGTGYPSMFLFIVPFFSRAKVSPDKVTSVMEPLPLFFWKQHRNCVFLGKKGALFLTPCSCGHVLIVLG